MSEYVKIPIEFAKNIHKVLENFSTMCYAVLGTEIKEMVSKEAYDKIFEIYCKYHNANCGPFNRTLKRIVEKENYPEQSKLDQLKERLNSKLKYEKGNLTHQEWHGSNKEAIVYTKGVINGLEIAEYELDKIKELKGETI